MEAPNPQSFSENTPSKPRELTWPVILSVDAELDYQYLCGLFEEFEPSLRSAMGQLVWRETRETPLGYYEFVLPEGITMPLIRVQYALTEKSIVIRKFLRDELLGSTPVVSKSKK